MGALPAPVPSSSSSSPCCLTHAGCVQVHTSPPPTASPMPGVCRSAMSPSDIRCKRTRLSATNARRGMLQYMKPLIERCSELVWKSGSSSSAVALASAPRYLKCGRYGVRGSAGKCGADQESVDPDTPPWH